MFMQPCCKIISVAMIILLFVIGVEIIAPAQERMITEYCIDHPNGSLQGDINLNCSDWLEDHPELVEAVMVEREGMDDE